MSGFTVGLAIIGGLLLAALVAWNAWTTRRNAPRQPESAAAQAAAPDVEERAEPKHDAQGDVQDHGTDHGRQDVPHHHQYFHDHVSGRSKRRQYSDANHGHQQRLELGTILVADLIQE